jgi:guanylate kinase
MVAKRGMLVIISGPSGVGKSTIVRELLSHCDVPMDLSVSATTRAPRTGEVDGLDYHFLSQDEFQRRQDAGEFLEACEVFSSGEWYGTLLAEVDPRLEKGRCVILEIDVQGALKVMTERPDAVSIFIEPRSLAVLEERLRGRATEAEEVIQRRLERSRREMAASDRYDYRVLNEQVPVAVEQICDILRNRSVHHYA